MYINANTMDPDLRGRVRVTLDGERVRHARSADDGEGYVNVLVRPDDLSYGARSLLYEGSAFLVEHRTGQVRIHAFPTREAARAWDAAQAGAHA